MSAISKKQLAEAQERESELDAEFLELLNSATPEEKKLIAELLIAETLKLEEGNNG